MPAKEPEQDPLEGHPVFEKLKFINSGSFGYVILAKNKVSGEQVAIKFVEVNSDKDLKHSQREIMNHMQLLHPHVVQLKEVFAAGPYLAIVMEYVPNGDMFNHVVSRRGLPENEARWFFQQLVLGMDYCHRKGVCNRDIKLENTLLVLQKDKKPLLKIRRQALLRRRKKAKDEGRGEEKKQESSSSEDSSSSEEEDSSDESSGSDDSSDSSEDDDDDKDDGSSSSSSSDDDDSSSSDSSDDDKDDGSSSDSDSDSDGSSSDSDSDSDGSSSDSDSDSDGSSSDSDSDSDGSSSDSDSDSDSKEEAKAESDGAKDGSDSSDEDSSSSSDDDKDDGSSSDSDSDEDSSSSSSSDDDDSSSSSSSDDDDSSSSSSDESSEEEKEEPKSKKKNKRKAEEEAPEPEAKKSKGGNADVDVIDYDGRPKGFGHVEFESVEGAAGAIQLSGGYIGDREIYIETTTERQQRTPMAADNGSTLFVKGFDKYLGEEEVRNQLTEAFSAYGTVNGVRLPTDRETGELKGIGYVEFATADEKNAAVELNGQEAAGGWLKVDPNPGAPTPRSGGDGGRGGGRGGVAVVVVEVAVAAVVAEEEVVAVGHPDQGYRLMQMHQALESIRR
eukprot:jgi/Picre1/27745/NNA_000709.t1